MAARDLLVAGAHRVQGRLVDEVGQVCAAHARRAPGHHVEVQVLGRVLALHVHLEDGQPVRELGQRHHHLAVEAARAKQGGVEDVGPVGGRQHHDSLGTLESVHLREHLVQGLLAFVVAAPEARAPLAGRWSRPRR